MSGPGLDLDALFERDADGRLLERRRREELGLAPLPQRQSSTPARFGAESLLADALSAPPRAALLRVALDARPEEGLIPGAVITVVATLTNDGDDAIADARLRVAIPPEVEPIAGSFARDEVAIDGEALVGEGIRLGAIPAGGSSRFRFSLRVLPGAEPIDLVAHATANGAPVIGAPVLRLERRSGHAAYEAPKAFFELEAGEIDDEIATETASAGPAPLPAVDAVVDEPVAPPVVVEADVVVPEPQAIVAEPEIVPEPVVVTEAAIVMEPAVVAAPAASADERIAVTAPLGPDELRALERVFAGGVPHGLAALAVLAGIATTGGPLGEALGLEPFRSAVAAALPRALVAARMGKPTPPVVTREILGSLRAHASVAAVPFVASAPTLVNRLDARDRDALFAVLARDLDDPFLRGVQVLLAIAPRVVEGAPSGADAADALAEYKRAAGAWLMRVTVKRAVDRRYDPLTADDEALHGAGRALVESLRRIVS